MMPDKILPKFVAYYQQDFAASARMNRRLTWLQRHIYRMLCLEAPFCETRPYLPTDDTQLAFLADVPDEVWLENKDAVLAMFTKTDSGYTHPRIEHEYEKACDKYERMKKLSQAGNAAQSHTSPVRATEQSKSRAEQDLDVEKNAAAAHPLNPASKPKGANGAAVSPEREALARAHFAKLVESGDKWALANQGDDSAFTRPAFVEHVLESEPRKRTRKYAHKGEGTCTSWDDFGAKPCKCGRPKPCEVHDLDLGDDLND
jgi:uncharacterized protein YdaU (DUF1376 family)